MAGSYPDVPGYRFAYDKDGTIGVTHNTDNGTVALHGASALQSLNSDNSSHIGDILSNAGSKVHAFIFPETRSVTGLLLRYSEGFTLQNTSWSSDTTDGLDGTWTTIAGFTRVTGGTKPTLRNTITPLSLSDVRAIRFLVAGQWSSRLQNLHIYGSIEATESPDRLRIIDLSDDDIAAQLDFGNLAQHASSTRQFKVVNNSATQTASNITVSLDVPMDASPSLLGQYQVSTDNIAFANAVNIGSLAPSAESGTLYIRMNPASNALLGLWSARIIAHPVSWS